MTNTESGFAQVQIKERQGDDAAFDFSALHAEVCAVFESGKTRALEWRKQQLRQIVAMVKENHAEMAAAVLKDHGGPKIRAFFELDMGKAAQNMLDNIDEWASPQRVKHTDNIGFGHSEVRATPKGVVLLIAPWNYPITLCMRPLTAIIAAGNCCVIKPSEVSSHSAEVLARLIPKYLDKEAVRVVTGAVGETTALLKLRWDHILYTGNGGVGRLVAAAAAKHLTPMTLELGGKSPTIIGKSARIPTAVARITQMKWINAGQTCIAPDYILVHKSVHKDVVQQLAATLKQWYGDASEESKDYGRVINERHVHRIQRLVDESSGQVTRIGAKASGNFFPPTLIDQPLEKDPIMQEEIFGPALPILPFDTIEEAIALTKRVCPRPLALYVFSEDKVEVEKVLNSTLSGGVCINSALEHNTNYELPFGGIGESGMGAYNGKWGFNEFSHHRAVFYKDTFLQRGTLLPPPPYKTDFLYDLAVKLEITGFLTEPQRMLLKAGAGALAAGGLYAALRSSL